MFSQRDTQTLATEDIEKANVLSDFFASVFTKEPVDELPTVCTKNIPYPMEELNIDEKSVEKILKNLRPSKSPGPDGIHPRILKELSGTLAIPLTMIFKSSLSTSCVPDSWKTANITPLFKKGDKKIHQTTDK